MVERYHEPLAVMIPADQPPRTLSELAALAEQREKERGYPITLDEDYAADVAQIVRDRKPWAPRSRE